MLILKKLFKKILILRILNKRDNSPLSSYITILGLFYIKIVKYMPSQ